LNGALASADATRTSTPEALHARWLTLSKKCMEIARSFASERFSFSTRLAGRASVQIMLGDLATKIEIGRPMVMKAARELDRGGFARKEVSMAKINVANLLNHDADTAIQINGARRYFKETVLEWIYRYARQACLADGADEVHKMVLNSHVEKEATTFWRWPVESAKCISYCARKPRRTEARRLVERTTGVLGLVKGGSHV
jgi:acyl-CoA dehydrogenase